MNAKIKEKETENKEIIDATVKETKVDAPSDKEPEKKKEGFFTKVGNGFKKVGNGIKKGLDKDVKLWKVIAAPIVVVGAVVGAKALYDKGRNDAMTDMDIPSLPEEEPLLELETEPKTEVIDVQEYEEPEEETEEIEEEEVYEEAFEEE